jgi:RimJ/RimL family protein N-acetyltransferase
VSAAPDWPIVTERLLLRSYGDADFDGVYAIESSDAVARWLYNDARNDAETRDLLARKIRGAVFEAEGDWLSTAVTLRESGALVGDVALHWVSDAHRCGEIGFTFNPAHQGCGYATEAARALLPFAFETMGWHRLIGRTEARNTSSARVLEKLGMRLEGHLVENEWVKGEWQSELDYALLAAEWRG